MFHFGKRDATTPADRIAELRRRHESHGAKVFLYDADHGFNCDQRGSYDARVRANSHAQRTLTFFRQHVG